MTPENAKKLLPIITAYAEGKIIEERTTDNKWVEYSTYSFSSHPDNYRIKKEPREYWLVTWKSGSHYFRGATQEDARKAVQGSGNSTLMEIVHVREVLDD